MATFGEKFKDGVTIEVEVSKMRCRLFSFGDLHVRV